MPRALFLCLFMFCLTAASYAKDILKEMSVEEKAGQLLMVHFNGEEANEDAKTLIQKAHVGGIIYYTWANGMRSPEQIVKMSLGLQELAKDTPRAIPLLIAADQEGGIVARLAQGFTRFPGNGALGMAADPSLVEMSAHAMGLELRGVGINMNLAPVVDVNSNPKNPIIGIRSFGSDPALVAVYGERALAGYHRAGIITTLKHYPGHGDASEDSHLKKPILKKDLHELESMELLPFSNLSSQSDAVMTAHLLIPALDPEHCSTLSPKTLSYLREKLGFQGVIISDSLIMQGVLDECSSIEEAVLAAIEAGCDIALLGGKQLIGGDADYELKTQDIVRIHHYLVEAVKNGRLSEERIDQSVQRILHLKERYNLKEAEHAEAFQTIYSAGHQALAAEIASRAIKITRKEPLSLKNKRVVVFAPQALKDSLNSLQMPQECKILLSFWNGSEPTEKEMEAAICLAEQGDALVICSYNGWKNPHQIACVDSLAHLNKPTVVIATRDSTDITLFPKAGLIISTSSPTIPSLQAAFDQLFH